MRAVAGKNPLTCTGGHHIWHVQCPCIDLLTHGWIRMDMGFIDEYALEFELRALADG